MKTIGLIGGMSWESSIEYYRIINEATRERLGGLHSARSVMVSVDFAEIEQLQSEGRWEEAGAQMAAAARQIASGGADFVLLCTNTMHKLVEHIENAVDIPLLHIADATAREVQEAGIQTIGLLGTRFTMEEAFYKGRLGDRFGLQVITPNPTDRRIVDDIIYKELVVGRILPASKIEYARIIAGLIDQGAEGIILGCTEIGLLVDQADSSVPLFDTTRIHAEAAVDQALSL